jgi:ribosomal protein S16
MSQENIADNSINTEVQGVQATEPIETAGTYNPESSTKHDRMSLVQELLNQGASTEETVLEEPKEEIFTGEPQSTESQLEIPDKFKNADGTPNVEAILKSYQYAEKKISEQGSMLSQAQQMQQTIVQLQQMLEQQQQNAMPINQEVHPEIDLEAQKEEWFERFYDNPMEAIAELAQRSIEPVISPYIQQAEYQQQVASWSQKVEQARASYNDFDLLQPRIVEIIEQRPELANIPDAIDIAYKIAKSDNVQEQPKIEDMLKSPEFLRELANNPEVKKQVLSTYSQNLQSEAKPPVMGSQQGGTPPATPPQEIKSIKDASKASASFFSRVFGGS